MISKLKSKVIHMFGGLTKDEVFRVDTKKPLIHYKEFPVEEFGAEVSISIKEECNIKACMEFDFNDYITEKLAHQLKKQIKKQIRYIRVIDEFNPLIRYRTTLKIVKEGEEQCE